MGFDFPVLDVVTADLAGYPAAEVEKDYSLLPVIVRVLEKLCQANDAVCIASPLLHLPGFFSLAWFPSPLSLC